MSSAATRGAQALEKSDFALALTEYTRALIEYPTSPDYYIQRSIAFTRLQPARNDLALKDAEYAVVSARKRAKREKIQAAQHRRVVAMYKLGRYADAKAILSTMERWKPADSKPAKMELDMWNARVDAKLKTLSDPQQVATVQEYPDIELASEAKLKADLQSQLKPDGSYKFPEEISTETSNSTVANGKAKQQSTTPQAAIAAPKIRHEWYQNPETVTITIYAKGVAKDKVQTDLNDDSISISFPLPQAQAINAEPSSTFDFSLDPLFAFIRPDSSRVTVMSTKIEIVLKKVAIGQKWHNLEGNEPLKDKATSSTTNTDDVAKAAILSSLTSPTATETAQAPSYPTSSRTGPKNWDRLADDLHVQSKTKKSKTKTDNTEKGDTTGSDGEDYDSDYDGADPVDGFFKKLYAGSDEDTRRAMMKSFYESNGTALSTNWSEVGKGKVDEVKSKDD